MSLALPHLLTHSLLPARVFAFGANVGLVNPIIRESRDLAGVRRLAAGIAAELAKEER